MDKVEEFLSSDHKVLLLLGHPGVGKSTFCRELECNLWRIYEKGDRIPLLIDLASIDQPEQDLIVKQLLKEEFTPLQISELKASRKFLLICDGYDKSRQDYNLYTSNRLNQPGEWNAQILISCRIDYLGRDYHSRFQPVNQSYQTEGMQELVIVPFSSNQAEDYIKKYVTLEALPWDTASYLKMINLTPTLQAQMTNPLLLTLAMEALARLLNSEQDFSAMQNARVALYDQLLELWLEHGKKRLEQGSLRNHELRAFTSLCDDGFIQRGILFLNNLAVAMYEKQAGHPLVEYSHTRDQGTWKETFFGQEVETQLLREACSLTRSGNQYQFIDKSLQEYCLARSIFEPPGKESTRRLDSTPVPSRRGSIDSILSFESLVTPEESMVPIEQAVLESSLARKMFVGEPSILQFLVERVQQELSIKQQLLAVIQLSKVDKEVRKAAANAITILVKSGVQFDGVDLKGIQIPGADLSGGLFDSAQLQGADLRKVNLHKIRLHRANLSNTRMSGVPLGEWPYLKEDGMVESCAYSPDGRTCAVGLENGTITIYDTTTWVKIYTLHCHTVNVRSVTFSPSSHQIATGSSDMTVRLWDAQTGIPGPILSGHTGTVRSIAYSPSGQQLASGSDDKTVRLWDVQTGAPGPVLSGHNGTVQSVVYSPSGQQIASGGRDSIVRLWDAQTGAPSHTSSGHTDSVQSVVYSPSSQQIASGSLDKTVRLWDAQTGALGLILSSHTESVQSIVYSPSGQQLASGSDDETVWLWDAQTGTPGPILSGHTSTVRSVVYSPSGQYIASGGEDKTVRLWNTQTSAHDPTLRRYSEDISSVKYRTSDQQIASGIKDSTVRLQDVQSDVTEHILIGHTGTVLSVMYSPSGYQIATGSSDMTVRLWDAQTGIPGPILSGHTGAVRSIAYSDSGQQLASGSDDKTARLWDAQTGAPGPVLSGHNGAVQSVVYSPSGQQIASGGEDNTVRLWDAQTGAPGFILSSHTESVQSIVYSPNGQQIALRSLDRTVQLWDAHTGVLGPILSGHTSLVCSVVYSPSGQHIATGSLDKTVRLWDARTGAPGPILSSHTSAVWSVVYSLNGRQIATGSSDMTVWLWDAQTGIPGPILSGHTGTVRSVVYSPSGRQIATGSDDKTVRLWDAQSGASGPILGDFIGAVRSVTYSPSGWQIAIGSDDEKVRLWSVQPNAYDLISSDYTDTVQIAAYSPKSQLITSESAEKTVQVRNAQTSIPGPALSDYTDTVQSVAYSPNKQEIASGSLDMTVQPWDAQPSALDPISGSSRPKHSFKDAHHARVAHLLAALQNKGFSTTDTENVIVIGKTGSGKSSIISLLLGYDADVGHGIYSETTNTTEYDFCLPAEHGGRRVSLIDTRGVMDTEVNLTEVLESLVNGLTRRFNHVNTIMLVLEFARLTPETQAALKSLVRIFGLKDVERSKRLLVVITKAEHLPDDEQFMLRSSIIEHSFFKQFDISEEYLERNTVIVFAGQSQGARPRIKLVHEDMREESKAVLLSALSEKNDPMTISDDFAQKLTNFLTSGIQLTATTLSTSVERIL
ncbi:hypothetical protein BGZ98_010106, partial [Dissophora globulifera]